MKKMLVTVAAAMAICASVAMAATPAAPVFSMTVKTTKVADGFAEVNDSRQVVVDGSNVYVAFTGPTNLPSISRSTDGGYTWTTPAVMSTTGSQIRIAKAKDPLNSTKNIIVAAWSDVDGLKYSYLTNRTTTSGWSVPTVVTSNTVEPWTLKIGSSPDGAVHLMYSDAGTMYYTYAANAESVFWAPDTLSWCANGDNYGVAFDSANNVYVAETSFATGGDNLYFHKKAAGSSTWSTVTVAATAGTTSIGDNVSIAVYDANNIYIAYKQYSSTDSNPTNHIWVAVSTNGGSTWTKRIVTPNSTVYGTYPSITVNSTKVISVVGHYVDWGPTGRISVNKSSDNGATWSANVTVPGNSSNGSTLDSTGKVVVLSALYGFTELDPIFFSGTVTDWGSAQAIYFTREK